MRKYTTVHQIYRTALYKSHVPYALKAGMTRKELAELILKCTEKVYDQERLLNNGKDILTSLVILPWHDVSWELQAKYGDFMKLIVEASDSNFAFKAAQ